MNVYWLVLYFFCWIVIGIDVSLAAEREDTDDEGKLAKYLNKVSMGDSLRNRLRDGVEVTEDGAAGSGDSCQLSIKRVPRLFQTLGRREHMMNSFKENLEKSGLKEYVEGYEVAFTLVALEENVQDKMGKVVEGFLHNTELIRDNLLSILPRISDSDHFLLKKQYRCYDHLQWSYDNKKIVTEADAISENLTWIGGGNLTDELLNSRMYHVLNAKVIEMKNLLSTWDSKMALAQKIHNYFISTDTFVKHLPLSVTYDTMNVMLSAYNNISSCVSLLDNKPSLADLSKYTVSIDNTYSALDKLLKTTNKQVENNVLNMKKLLEEVATEKDEHLQENLLAHCFIGISNMYEKEPAILLRESEISHFKEILQLLQDVSDYKADAEVLFQEAQKKILTEEKLYVNMTLDDILNSQKNKGNSICYSKIAKHMIRVIYLNEWKKEIKEIMALLESVKKRAISEATKQGSTHTTGSYVTEKIIENLKIKLQFFKFTVGRACEEHEKHEKLTSILLLYQSLRALTRKLNYFWGTANLISSKLVTDVKYKSDKKKLHNTLKKVALNLYNSVLAIDDMLKIQ